MTNLNIPLEIDSLKIILQTVDTQGNIVVDVESTQGETPCHKCGKSANKRYGFGDTIMVHHLPIFHAPLNVPFGDIKSLAFRRRESIMKSHSDE